jgi:Amt family ammonium transporter
MLITNSKAPGETMRTAPKKIIFQLLSLAGVALAALAPTLALAADAPPVPNKGDTAWMLTSTALVLLMSVPALGLFYGGLVRSKNMLSVLMQVFVGFSLITVLWCVYGYSLAFTTGNEFIGGFDRLFLKGTFDSSSGTFSLGATFSKATPMYELVFVAFQATFAAITCCLIIGSLVERVKFSGILLFLVIWFTFSYLPVAHMVWFWAGPDAYTDDAAATAANATAGLLWQWGALDFAGGTVVHINSGVAGLVAAFILGKREEVHRQATRARDNLALSALVDDLPADPDLGRSRRPARRARRECR